MTQKEKTGSQEIEANGSLKVVSKLVFDLDLIHTEREVFIVREGVEESLMPKEYYVISFGTESVGELVFYFILELIKKF